MHPDDIDITFKIAALPALERLQRDRERCPARFAPLLGYVEDHLFDANLSVSTARRTVGLRDASPPLGTTLPLYIGELRVLTARRLLKLAAGRLPTGRAARAVGFRTYQAFVKSWRRVLPDERLKLVRRDVRPSPRFHDGTWHLAWRGELTPTEVRTLGRRLRRLYPAAFDNGPPRAEPLVAGPAEPRPASRPEDVPDTEVRAALERASAAALRRLRRDSELLQPNHVAFFRRLEPVLFDPELELEDVRRRAGVRDTALSTKVLFYLGDTPTDYVEKRRLETAVLLLEDPRLKIARVAEAVGLGERPFPRLFRKRLGAYPSEVRRTAHQSAGHPAFVLWRRAESRTLSVDEARRLGAYLRALDADTFADPSIQGAGHLAVRVDVEPRRVDVVVKLDAGLGADARSILDEVLATHPRYSAARWYACWVRDRLGHAEMATAWPEWLAANGRLRDLLHLPPEQQKELVRTVRTLQSDAFVWLLADAVAARLFQDAGESERFADLAGAATEGRTQWDSGQAAVGLRGLALALKGNALRRQSRLEAAREYFDEAFAMKDGIGNSWIEGQLDFLHARLLEDFGLARQARRSMFRATATMKKVGDELERLRLVVARVPIWFAAGLDPSRILKICKTTLRRYLFASDLVYSVSHMRLTVQLYLRDQLTGRYLSETQELRRDLPSLSPPLFERNRQQIDGMIAVLEGDPRKGAKLLETVARWYGEHELLADAAVSWLQYSWAVLEVDSEEAAHAALTAYTYMTRSGFDRLGQQSIARRIHLEAEGCSLNRETLRRGILLSICPKIEVRLANVPSRTVVI